MKSAERAFGLHFDPVSTSQLARRIAELPTEKSQIIVTPNVAHISELHKTQALMNVYSEASIIVADGLPVYLWCRLKGVPLPGRVTGQDLLKSVIERGLVNQSVCFVTSTQEVAKALQRRLIAELGYSAEQVSILVAPARVNSTKGEAEDLAYKIKQSSPSIVVLGFGFPQSEVFAATHLKSVPCYILCVGSAVDVLSGLTKRAPKIWGRLGLEWLWRLCREPRRLWRRYLWESRFFLAAIWRDIREVSARG